MNVFILDKDPIKAADMLCDKHVVKMCTESAQILSSAQRILGNTSEFLYKIYRGNPYPLKWVLLSSENYKWVLENYKEILKEYTRRYGKEHGAGNKNRVCELSKIPNLPSLGLTLPPCGTKGIYKIPNPSSWEDIIINYKYFYYVDKKKFAKWAHNTSIPSWYLEEELNEQSNI